MYAIVEIAGKQYKVEKDNYIYTNRLSQEAGSKLDLASILLIDNNGSVKVGTPTVSGAKVTASVVEHLKGDKVLVFKKKRRKDYKKTQGHRQYLTKVKIENITA